jgi:hypothetical protein
MHTSDPAIPAALRKTVENIAEGLSVRRRVRLLLSSRLDTPVVAGWLRPAILLPAAALTGLTPEQLRAVLAHELAHIRRHDFLVNLLQGAVESLLFYHPAVWWLSARIRAEREHCCDDLAIEVCGDRLLYARALVELEQSRHSAPAVAVAATGGELARRIRRVLGGEQSRRDWLEPAAVSILVVAVLILGASHANPVKAQAPPPPLPPPAQGTRSQAPPPPPPPPPRSDSRSFRMDRSEGPSWVMYRGESTYMNGSTADEIEARAARRKISGDFLWFQIGGRAYVVQDRGTLDTIGKLYEPMNELGEEQRKLGEQQRALGEQQRALGEKMREVRTVVPDMDAEIESIQRRLKELRAGATQDELGRLQSELGRLQSRLGSIMGQAGQQQSAIGQQQGELGRKQGELGRQQGELGRKQGEIARQAHAKVTEMLRELVSSGRAKSAP